MEHQNSYTVELDKAGDKLNVCYWLADTLEQAQSLLQQLKNGCTAYDVTLTIRDSNSRKIESWKLGNELKPAIKQP